MWEAAVESSDDVRQQLKRVLYLPEWLSDVDQERVRFPGGVVCRVEGQDEVPVARRIEVLAEGTCERIGLLRKIFVGFSSQPEVLDVARRSNYVVEVRSVDWSKKHVAEHYKQDVLVLKSAMDQAGPRSRKEGMRVPSIWMEQLGLASGDHVIVSNPLRNYLIPSPGTIS